MTAQHLTKRLRAVSVPARAARNTTFIDLAAELPSKVVSRLLPALTGMPRSELGHLTADLRTLDQQRPRIKSGRPPTVAFTDQVLLTVLHQRLGLAIEPLAVLFGTSRTTAYRTTCSIGALLDQHGTHITPAPTPPGLLRVLHARVLAEDTKAANKIKPAC